MTQTQHGGVIRAAKRLNPNNEAWPMGANIIEEETHATDMLAFIEKVAAWDFEGIGDYEKLENAQHEAFMLIKKGRV